MGTEAAVKRWWLELAFFPNGGDITRALGLVPASDDVEQAALHQIGTIMTHLYGETTAFDQALQMARWYVEGVAAAEQFGVAQRTVEEHLVSFMMAALASGVVVLPQEAENDG